MKDGLTEAIIAKDTVKIVELFDMELTR